MEIQHITALFGVDTAEYEQIATGHINLTYLVTSGTGERYILQSLNREVFNNPEAVMLNISAAEAVFTSEKSIAIPRFMRHNGHNYAECQGEIWRMYPYIPDVENVEKYYHAGFAHGRFIRILSRENVELKPTIGVFHNYSAYVEKLKAVGCRDEKAEKLCELGKQLEEVFADVPKRNIHGDAKADNIIIGKPCTVIDLDTMMQGYAAIDYGDMVRSACADSVEDLTRGFAEGLDGLLTEREVQSLYYGILWVTGELAVRYLIDVYSEKPYFKGKTKEQCRERADSLISQLESFTAMKSGFDAILRKYF